ncbi:hypothetical protein ScPMuIL_006379 [Solemya velum]
MSNKTKIDTKGSRHSLLLNLTGGTPTTTNGVQMIEFPPPPESPQREKYTKGYQFGRPSLVKKSGHYRVSYKGLGGQGRSYLLDLYQTLVDLKWRWALLVLFLVFFLVYLTFAIIWYTLSYLHGDFQNHDNANWVPCIERLKTFGDALLFSIETQTTIGYGTFYPNTSACGGSLPILFVQVTIGFLLETILLGFILVKIARPKHRRHTLMFSNNACICKEDSQMTLQIRLGDMRHSHLVDTSFYGIFIREKVSSEGSLYPLFQTKLDFEVHGMDDRVFLMWPLVLKHKITEDSPLWEMRPEDILSNTFEIVVVLEGTIESTGEICQARSSYSSNDILWSFRFANMIEFDAEHAQWRANFKLFNDVIPSPTPKVSAREMTEIYGGSGAVDKQKMSEAGPHLRKAFSHTDPLNVTHVKRQANWTKRQEKTKPYSRRLRYMEDVVMKCG